MFKFLKCSNLKLKRVEERVVELPTYLEVKESIDSLGREVDKMKKLLKKIVEAETCDHVYIYRGQLDLIRNSRLYSCLNCGKNGLRNPREN